MAGQKRSSIPNNFSLLQHADGSTSGDVETVLGSTSSDVETSNEQYSSTEDNKKVRAAGVSSEFDFDLTTLERIRALANQRGVSCEKLITDVIDSHSKDAVSVQKYQSNNIYSNTGIDNRNRMEHAISRKSSDNEALYPLRFIDPSDIISPEEDFKELNSNDLSLP